MRRFILGLLAATAVAAATAGPAAAAGPYDSLLAPAASCPDQSDASLSVDRQEAAMLCMINFARARSGLRALTRDARLMPSTDSKARDIVACNEFSHTACGKPWDAALRASGYAGGCGSWGENIAWGSGSYATVRSIMSGWLNSSGHRANILNSRYADQGVGMVKATFQGYRGAQVWVSHFGYRC